MVDASDVALDGVLQQRTTEGWKPLSFYSKKLSDTQKKYSTYDRELLAAYSVVKYYRHMLEGRQFIIFTDHKTLTFAFRQNLDKATPRQFRHLDYLAQFSTDIRHISGSENIVADALLRISTLSMPTSIDYNQISDSQKSDTELKASTLAEAFYSGWISRFGVPAKISTDQGRQFESHLFRELVNILGATRIRTSPYHPSSNGMVERWHRSLKSALMCHNTKNWLDVLPTVLLGLRSSIREDINSSPFELTYGTTIKLPGDMLTETQNQAPTEDFVTAQKKKKNERSQPCNSSSQTRSNCLHFKSSRKLYTRIRAKRWNINGKEKVISIDRIKPAFIFNTDISEDPAIVPVPNVQSTPPEPTLGRSTRNRRPPVRFK
ncbi:uncharacterized protein LOC142231040 [Haematobia irritans]|uniref:uncharacterized protein LOC142231040 n=1 Tax=Haematobia irritans TaxID=7368 RepID=UPI003F50786D